MIVIPENWSYFFICWKIFIRKKQPPSPVPYLHTRSRITGNSSWEQQSFWPIWKGSQQNTGFPSVLDTFLHPPSSQHTGTEDARPALRLLTMAAYSWQVSACCRQSRQLWRAAEWWGGKIAMVNLLILPRYEPWKVWAPYVFLRKKVHHQFCCPPNIHKVTYWKYFQVSLWTKNKHRNKTNPTIACWCPDTTACLLLLRFFPSSPLFLP